MQTNDLYAPLTDINVIRHIFDTIALLANYDPMIQDLHAVVEESRVKLKEKLKVLTLASRPPRSGSPLEPVLLMGPGVRRQELDGAFRIDLFLKVAQDDNLEYREAEKYKYEFNRKENFMAAFKKSDQGSIFLALINDVLESAEKDENFASKQAFDRSIAQRYYAILYVYQVSGGSSNDLPPSLDNGPDGGGKRPGGSPGGAPVPRTPLTPLLSPGAEEPIPRGDVELVDCRAAKT